MHFNIIYYVKGHSGPNVDINGIVWKVSEPTTQVK